jgi:hypothetical protein
LKNIRSWLGSNCIDYAYEFASIETAGQNRLAVFLPEKIMIIKVFLEHAFRKEIYFL